MRPDHSSTTSLDQYLLSHISESYKLALLPTASRDKAFLVIVMQFSFGRMIKEEKIQVLFTKLIEPVTILKASLLSFHGMKFLPYAKLDYTFCSKYQTSAHYTQAQLYQSLS